MPSHALCLTSTLELSNYFDYIKHHDVFFTIMMLMMVCHNCDNYSGFKDPNTRQMLQTSWGKPDRDYMCLYIVCNQCVL